MLISPAERDPALTSLGNSSPVPERFGADYFWSAKPVGLVGVQRKAFPGDFLASVRDGRLEKELGQMRALDVAVLVLEGRGRWTTEGELIFPHSQQRWTRSGHRRLLCSIQARGVWVQTTDDVADTVACIRDVEAWSRKSSHNATKSRPAAKRDGWGRIDDHGYLVHFTGGLPDVGPVKGAAIVDSLGCIFELKVSEEQLRRVHGIGKVGARKIIRVFEVGA